MMVRILSPARSLSSKLILFFLLCSVVPMLFLTAFNTWISTTNVTDVTRNRIGAHAESVASRIDFYLNERKSDSTVVAALPSIHNTLLEDDLEGAELVITAIEDAYGYAAVSIFDENGDLVISTDEALVQHFIENSERADVQAALQGEVAISDVHTHNDQPMFHTTAPVFGEDGAIIGIVDLLSTTDELDTIVDFDTGRTGEGSYGVLLDETLVRIAIPAHNDHLFMPLLALSPAEEQRMIAAHRFGDETSTLLRQDSNLVDMQEHVDRLNAEDRDQLFFSGVSGSTNEHNEAVLQRLSAAPWYYIHQVPDASFYSIVNQQTFWALVITACTAFFSIFAIVMFARQVLNRPLSQFMRVTQAFSSGDLGSRLALQQRDELGVLANSFNDMADSLETRIKSEQEAQAEALRLQQIEQANRQTLEQTVQHYLVFTQSVAQGDLSQRLEVQHNGALGSLGQGLNHMVESLQGITAQVQQASANIAAAATEILAATTQQASSATEQSSAVSQTSTTLDEIMTIAHQTAQQAEQVAQESQAAIVLAQRGMHSVEANITSMEQIRQRVESIAQTILSLAEQTQAIGNITTTVSELADQSNMLALNAAIEAARAGEQGKSFAVVAQNVRDLAERSKAATVQVREILSEIQQAANAAVLVTEEGSKGVDVGVHQANEVGQMIHQIVTEVENESQANTQMAAAAHQQSTGIEQIGQAVNAIRQATHQTIASTRQAERAAQDLNNLAQSLQDTIAIYHV
jgi:methyl-accepting chemotaxis protein